MPGRPPAARIERAMTIGPDVDVALGVGDDGRLAGRAGGGVDARDPVVRHGDHAERIGVAQIGLGGEGELRQILERAAVLGVDARGVELGAGSGERCRRRA